MIERKIPKREKKTQERKYYIGKDGKNCCQVSLLLWIKQVHDTMGHYPTMLSLMLTIWRLRASIVQFKHFVQEEELHEKFVNKDQDKHLYRNRENFLLCR